MPMAKLENLIVQNLYSEYFDSTFTMEPHAHKAYEITYVRSGIVGFHFIKDSVCTTELLYPGDFIIINSDTNHKMFIPKNNTASVYNFELLADLKNKAPKVRMLNYQEFDFHGMPKLHQFVASVDELHACKKVQQIFSKDFDYLLFDDSGDILPLITKIHKEGLNQTDDTESLLSLKFLLGEFFIGLSRCEWLNHTEKLGNIHINKLINYIKTNLKGKLKIEELAEFVELDKAYMQRLFKKCTGYTIRKYLTLQRMEKAKQLFEQGYSIAKTTKAVGYTNQKSFTTNFVQCVGITPEKYLQLSSSKIYNLGDIKGAQVPDLLL